MLFRSLHSPGSKDWEHPLQCALFFPGFWHEGTQTIGPRLNGSWTNGIGGLETLLRLRLMGPSAPPVSPPSDPGSSSAGWGQSVSIGTASLRWSGAPET